MLNIGYIFRGAAANRPADRRVLTIPFACAKHCTAMHKTSLKILAATALLSLAACGGQAEPEIVDSRAPDPLASQIANAAPVELPPAIRARATLRCADNSLVFVDFFQGDLLANFRTEQGAPPVQLTAEEAGQPLSGGGVTVTGTPQQITLEQPGKGTLTCRA